MGWAVASSRSFRRFCWSCRAMSRPRRRVTRRRGGDGRPSRRLAGGAWRSGRWPRRAGSRTSAAARDSLGWRWRWRCRRPRSAWSRARVASASFSRACAAAAGRERARRGGAGWRSGARGLRTTTWCWHGRSRRSRWCWSTRRRCLSTAGCWSTGADGAIRTEERPPARAAEQLGLRLREIRRTEPYKGARDHHLHVFEKVAETPSGFPAGRASPASALWG